MKGDFSRDTFDPLKHFSRVLTQQGRVSLDADWNEQADITAHRTETEARDVITRRSPFAACSRLTLPVTICGAPAAAVLSATSLTHAI